jgi:hypothetical protein
VWVGAHLQNVDLPPDFLGHLQVFNLSLIQYFNRNFESGHDMVSDCTC